MRDAMSSTCSQIKRRTKAWSHRVTPATVPNTTAALPTPFLILSDPGEAIYKRLVGLPLYFSLQSSDFV